MQLPRLLLLLLLAAAVARARGEWGQGPGEVAVFEAPSAEAVERGKQALDKWTAQAATERGLVNVLFGSTCYTTAMTALNRECGQLSNEQRMWLAIQFTMCFQRSSGFKVLDCPAVCPRRRSLQSCVEECTSRMDDRQQMTYTQLFGDVLNMCLFLQTQQFQQITAALVTDMHASSTAANASLAHIRSDLLAQAQSLAQSLSALNRLQAVQSEVESAVQAGLVEVRGLSQMSQGLQQSMDKSINMTSVLSSRHDQLMSGFSELELAHQVHAARAREAFEQLAQEAAALEHRQARYEALQSRLLNASEGLLDQSQDMNNLLRVLMHYQEKGNTILTQLQGSSVSLHDVLFYTLALSIPLVFITYPSDIRILLLAGVLMCWGVERAVLQHYVMLFGPARHHSKAAADGKVSVGSVSSFTRVHDVKVAVRLVVLGGTLGVVVWLLLKRRAVHNRKEAIFQAIQQSLQQAQYHDAAAAYQPAPAAPQPIPAPINHMQIIPAGPSSGSRGAKHPAAAVPAYPHPPAPHAPPMPAQPLLHPGVLLHQAAAAGSLQLPPTPSRNVRGWLPGSLLGSSQRSNLSDELHPAQMMQLMQQMGSHAGVHVQAPSPASAHLSQTPLGHHVHPQMLLPGQQQQPLQPQASQQLQQQLAAVQHHVVPSTGHLTQQRQYQQESCTHSESAMETEGTAAAAATAAEDVEESVGTGAAAGRQKVGGRTGSTAKHSKATTAGKAAAGRKRSAAAARAGEASREQSAVVEDGAEQAPKQGRPKRKK